MLNDNDIALEKLADGFLKTYKFVYVYIYVYCYKYRVYISIIYKMMMF